MKRGLNVFILGLILISFSMSFVSAATGPVEAIQSMVSGAYELIKPLLVGIVGSADDAEFFLVKVMLMFIVFAVIHKSLEKVPFFSEVTWVLWVISVAVSILSVRWLGDTEIVQNVLLPYSVLGIALTAGIPFVVYFFMTIDFDRIMRKVSWIFFIVVFLTIWITRLDELTGASQYIYLITAGAGLIVLLADGTIQGLMHDIKIEKHRVAHNNKLIREKEDELAKEKQRLGEGRLTPEAFVKIEKDINKTIAALRKSH